MTTSESANLSAESYRDFAQRIAGEFLQTVVVVDNEAQFAPVDELNSELAPPSSRGDAAEIELPLPEASIEPREPLRNTLDAKVLNDAFALSGLICSVLRPNEGQDIAKEMLAVARRADIVILDWKLFDQGEKATDIISQIRTADEIRLERLRLIAVYTGEPSLQPIRDSVKARLSESASAATIENDDTGGKVALNVGHMRIVFLVKGAPANSAPNCVDEATLPSRLLDEFSILASGFLPTAVLAAISVVREETHRLLARLHRDLDGACLSHRFLIPEGADASQFIMQLISDEVRAVLETHQVGERVAGFEPTKRYLEMLERDGTKFELPLKPSQTATTVDIAKVIALAEHGIPDDGSMGSRSSIHERLCGLLYETTDDGRRRHLEFSRISSLKREAFQKKGFPAHWRPRLSQGSIIYLGGNYLVCIQPLCDAVRLTEFKSFLFAQLIKKDSTGFDIVVQDLDGRDILLAVDLRPYQLVSIRFGPSQGTHFSAGTRESDGTFTFQPEDQNGEKARWIADLREAHAMRLIQKIASQLSRVGLDEFEWQRKHAEGKGKDAVEIRSQE